ncbi:glutaredoxin [Neisseria gonorrhoeae]|uniref:glutaredoxin n=1 Tax=Neisseria TaxID=482 RepID=UPI000A92CB6B|nr:MULTISPECIES: glutaredoxin [Neisseria]MCC9011981.1 glutaredoxin [Neisseria gonorrhoeae]MCC9109967.1 glutaredoxin [Neisseria gonorrhoeae]MCF2987288.1 glutaredoxin [Neisseria gonorrhoeae]MCF3059169.1 glutaredoxin [Neisseria gonorrhoeae]MCF3068517.1 glutaredoxin [Neisseria gonorrhoeae]
MPSERSDGIFNAQKKTIHTKGKYEWSIHCGKTSYLLHCRKGRNGSVNQQKHCTFINVKKH